MNAPITLSTRPTFNRRRLRMIASTVMALGATALGAGAVYVFSTQPQQVAVTDDSGVAGPLNILGGIPTVATDYSPIWDLNVYAWTKAAIIAGYCSRLIEEFQVLGLTERGYLTGPGESKFGSSGFVVNCPIVFRFK